jgi:hypothetical protein
MPKVNRPTYKVTSHNRTRAPDTKKAHREVDFLSGGRTQNRTGDTRIFSPLLYRLSYPASLKKGGIKRTLWARVNTDFYIF